MSEPHEDVARRLATLGHTTPAPPDLRGEVMAQVAAEPRRPGRNPRWAGLLRPARVALAASALVAAGVGITHLGGSGSLSGSGSGSASNHAAVFGIPKPKPREDKTVEPNYSAPSPMRTGGSTPGAAYRLGSQTNHPALKGVVVDRLSAQAILGRYYSPAGASGVIVARVPAEALRDFQVQLSATSLAADPLWQALDARQFVRVLLVAARDRRH
jgi:hypothetical protein